MTASIRQQHHERSLYWEDGSPQEADLRGRLWHVASLEPLSHPRLRPHDEGIPGYASLRALSTIGLARNWSGGRAIEIAQGVLAR
jgi:hypothetical protein